MAQEQHLPALLDLPSAGVVGAADTDAEYFRRAAAAFRLRDCCGGHRAVLDLLS